MKKQYALSVMTLLALLAVGCQTTGPQGDESAATQARQATFVPAGNIARLQAGVGQYPALFSAASTATWVQSIAGPMKDGGKAAANSDTASAMTQHYHVFECALESMFADRSIAYDVVGLRSIQVHLETPSGKRIPTTQTMIGRDLSENAQGALKVYGRTILLAFAKDAAPLIGSGTVRLVLQGHGTTFYFEWQPQPQMVSIKKEARQERVTKVKDGIDRSLATSKRISHRFD